tara:strand:+ start:1581 stop:1742 length:162 start_codon:yes stop_codon:yes gene_type:complete
MGAIMSIYRRTTKKTSIYTLSKKNIPVTEGIEIENIGDVPELYGIPVAEVIQL